MIGVDFWNFVTGIKSIELTSNETHHDFILPGGSLLMKEEMKHFAILETISKLNEQDWQMEKIVKFSFENADGSDDETHRGKGDINQLSRTYHIDVPIPASEIKRSVLLIFIFDSLILLFMNFI